MLDLETGSLVGGRLPRRSQQESLTAERFDADAMSLAIGRHGLLGLPEDGDFDEGAEPRTDEILLVHRADLSGPPFREAVGTVVATPEDLRALTLTRDAVVIAHVWQGALVVVFYGRDAGELLFVEILDIPFDPQNVTLIPIHGALVVAATSRADLRLFLARIETAP